MKEYGVLTSNGRYTKFSYMDYTVTFLTSKDLIRYVSVKDINDGVLTVSYAGKVKKIWGLYWYFIYIENFENEPRDLLKGIKGSWSLLYVIMTWDSKMEFQVWKEMHEDR